MLFIPSDKLNITEKTDSRTIATLSSKLPGYKYMNISTQVDSFEGLNACLNYVQENMKVAQRQKSSSSYTSGFHHFRDYETALNTYKNNPESIREFTENDVVLSGGDSSGIDVDYDVTGDFLDVDRYLTGEPEHFGSMYNGLPRGKRVTIVFIIGFSGGTGSEYINQRCNRIARLTDWLESQGIRVQIIGVKANQIHHVEITIKHFDEPIDLNAITIVAHADFVRRIMFRMAEYSNTFSNGYGSSATTFNPVLRGYTHDNLPYQLQEGHVILIGSMGGDIDDIFNNLESELTEVLSDPDNNNLILNKVML